MFGDRDPYLRQQRAAEHWLAAHGPASDERAVRVYGMLRFGGHKGLATAMVRGWRERLAQPGVPWGLEWQADRTGYLMCPYRYSQHGGASPGGGTWAAQWRKAWVRGVQFANQHLRALPPQ